MLVEASVTIRMFVYFVTYKLGTPTRSEIARRPECGIYAASKALNK